MSQDAVMSNSRDSAEEQREGPEMMSIDQKPSNVSMMSVATTATALTVETNPPAETESRDDSGGAPSRGVARPDTNDERQGTTAATKKTKKGPPKKRNSGKGRNQGRQQAPPPGPYPPHQRGPMAYPHSQMMTGNGQPHGPPYGGHPSYGYGSTGGPDLYRGRPQYAMPPMHHHHQNHQTYGAPGPYHPSYGAGPYGPPPPHMYSYQGSSIRPPMSSFTSSSDDTASLGSSKSKGSKSGNKKRTIDGVAPPQQPPQQPLSSAFSMPRTQSNASTSSTVTAGNNTSTDTPNLTEDSPQKTRNQLPPLSSRPDGTANGMYDDAHKQGYHRRDFSGASTTSSLSVGGLSLSSYETRGTYQCDCDVILIFMYFHNPLTRFSLVTLRATGSKDDAPMMRNSPKRRRQEESTQANNGSAQKLSVKTDEKEHRENLFLSLSTSPINSDVEATPVSKNTKKTDAGNLKTEGDTKPSVQELKQAPSMDSIRHSDTPTPPVPSGAAGSGMITDDHLLNRHLRGQTFTPLPHISQYTESRDGNASPPGIAANPSFGSTIGAQLSWDITGDAPSLGEIGDWEEPPKDQRPGSVASHASGGAFAQWKEGEMVPSSHYPVSGTGGNNYDSVLRLSVLSPNSDEEMEDTPGASAPGGTTPIPFYDNHERENSLLKQSASFSKDGSAAKPAATTSMGPIKFGDAEHIHHLFVTNGGRGSETKNNTQQRTPMNWNGSSNYMRYPPSSLYTSSEKSPMDGSDRVFFPSANTLLSLHQAGANDRIRNLRGRAPPGALRMPMTHQLPTNFYGNHNLTSPMGTSPATKATDWSPHALPSPNRVMQPDPNSDSKRKCLPMKPPIPTKFQG